MSTVDELYQGVIEAANKASAASRDYVQRESELEALIEQVCDQKGFRPKTTQYRVIEDDYKDNDKLLQKALGRWYFWQREQLRRSDLLRTHIAYCQFYGKVPYAQRPAAARGQEAHEVG